MTDPMPTPQPPQAEATSDGITWFFLPAIIILIAVMLLASRQDSATEVVTAAAATPEQITTGQTALTTVGCYTGEIDGQYGTQTDQAILDFQRASGIAVDGVFGPDTLAALQSAVNTGTTVCEAGDTAEGDTGDGTDGGDTGDGTDAGSSETRDASLTSASYDQTFTMTSWDCTGEAGDLSLEGSSDGALTIDVTVSNGEGTLAVDGGTEQDGITLDGIVLTLTKEPSSYAASGTFGEPSQVGETFTLTGTC